MTWLLPPHQRYPAKTQLGIFGAPPYCPYDTAPPVAALSVSKDADAAAGAAIDAGRAGLLAMFQGPSHKPPISCTPKTDWIYCGGVDYNFEAGRSDEPNTGFGLYGLKQLGGVAGEVADLNVGWQR